MLSATPNTQTFVEIRHETTDAKSIAFPLVTEIPVASEEIEVLLGEKVQARVRETFPVRQDTVKGRVAGGIAEEQVCNASPPARAQFTETWAHRGASKGYPENTLASFINTCKTGIQGIETDIHMTLDNQLILFHDPDLSRTTDGKGKIHCLPWHGVIENVRTLDAPHLPVPLFAQVLTLLAQHENRHVKLNIDCKVENDPDRLFGLMKTELEKFQNWQQVLAPRLILGVWHPGFVGPAQTHLPFLPRYAICMSIPTIRKYFFASCQGFSVWFPPLLSAEGAAFRAECKAKGKKLVVWTVNDVKEMKECLRWGNDVEAIITDCPDAVRSLAKKVKRTPAILSSSRFWKMLFPWSSLTYYSFRHLAEAQEWHEYLESQGGAFDGFLPDAEQVEQHQILLSSVEEASK